MRARLGFAIATSVEPDILLLDEVLATGDAAFREKSKARVLELVREAKAIVLVTHDMNWVTEYCNRAILIEKGRITHQGSPAEVVELHKEHMAERRAEAKEQGVLRLRTRGPGGAAPPEGLTAPGRGPRPLAAGRAPRGSPRISAVRSANAAPAASAPRQSRTGRTSPETRWAIITRTPVGRLIVTSCAISVRTRRLLDRHLARGDRAGEALGQPHLAGQRRPDAPELDAEPVGSGCADAAPLDEHLLRVERTDPPDVDLDAASRRLADPAALDPEHRVGEPGARPRARRRPREPPAPRRAPPASAAVAVLPRRRPRWRPRRLRPPP